jgi:hypothetical protein
MNRVGLIEPVPRIVGTVNREIVPGAVEIPRLGGLPHPVPVSLHRHHPHRLTGRVVHPSVEVEQNSQSPRGKDAEGSFATVVGDHGAQGLGGVEIAEEWKPPDQGPEAQSGDLQVMHPHGIQRHFRDHEGLGRGVGEYLRDRNLPPLAVGQAIGLRAGGPLDAGKRESDGGGTLDLGPQTCLQLVLLCARALRRPKADGEQRRANRHPTKHRHNAYRRSLRRTRPDAVTSEIFPFLTVPVSPE